ncbi:helix-turn-helix domain-containing protein [Flavivirga sp. 57AJ16]|uniref:winged helix-turn-helix transcriptional regulator n=1 Tax=Flavivirga sp. 57AJ16 TaxID=3025307 RepID=UPI00236696F8|nr:helix-turn-helix domain-containing protein [Flavivirga sp. 57AJ16]MDD7885471.1 helix-turn-helix domain-containing protein [Flavivirga sp. 57AJ16]
MNQSVNIIKKRWVIQILFSINKGCTRFSELKNDIVLVSDYMLAKCLKSLLNEEILEKHTSEDNELGPYYEFTKKGEDLMSVLLELRVWGKKYIKKEKIKINH